MSIKNEAIKRRKIFSCKQTFFKNIGTKIVFCFAHTSTNFITMLVTRAMANSSKNCTLLMCRIWKMGRNLFSSLDIRDNLKVAYLEKTFFFLVSFGHLSAIREEKWIWVFLGNIWGRFFKYLLAKNDFKYFSKYWYVCTKKLRKMKLKFFLKSL